MARYPERRKFVRVSQEDVFVWELFSLNKIPKKWAHAVTKNLSEGGLLFESAEAFDIGTILKLQVDIPGWEKYKVEFIKIDSTSGRHPLIALGKVVRVEDLGAKNFDIGVAFVALDSGHKAALRKYLSRTK